MAKYIGIDGFALRDVPRRRRVHGPLGAGPHDPGLGTTNVYLSDQGHTQSVGSAESFAAQYEFFTGEEPDTKLVLPEPPGQVEIAGRAVNFPANAGLAGSTLDVYEVKPESGERKSDTPRHTVSIGATATSGRSRSTAASATSSRSRGRVPDGPRFQHFYSEPFLRSNYLLRLNLSPLDSALSMAIDRGPHASVSVVRQKEWWGNNTVDTTNIDSLEITTRSGGETERAGNIINAATAPYTGSLIAVITFDDNVDGVTDTTAPVPVQPPFISGVRRLHAATEPPDGTIRFRHEQRRTVRPQIINTANWSSEAGHGMTVTFRDWVQDIDTWSECKRAKPSPCG